MDDGRLACFAAIVDRPPKTASRIASAKLFPLPPSAHSLLDPRQGLIHVRPWLTVSGLRGPSLALSLDAQHPLGTCGHASRVPAGSSVAPPNAKSLAISALTELWKKIGLDSLIGTAHQF